MDPGPHERGRQVRARVLIPAVAALAAALTPVSAHASEGGTTGRLLVMLERPGGTTASAAATVVVARSGARRSGHSAPRIGLVTVRPRRGESLRALAKRLRADPTVASVQVEHRFSYRALPNDPALTQQEPAAAAPPGTPIEWWAARQNFPAAWDQVSGTGLLVASIDSGVDATHPELAGRIRATVDLDDDPTEGPATTDEEGHGTHVASLACGNANNGIGFAGAGKNCSLLVIKSDFSDSSVAQAIVEATDRGAVAITMSFGTDGERPAADAIVQAIDYAFARNVVMVAAAADEPTSEQGYPADVLQPSGTGRTLAAGKGLSVTAADFADHRAAFAGSGSQISMAAYGTYGVAGGPRGIFAAFPAGPTTLETGLPGEGPCACRTTFAGDSRYAYVQGTSMAVPMVAGAAVLMRKANPGLTAADTIQLLKGTARRAPGVTGWTPDLGWGILDAGAAVAAARALDRAPPVSKLRAPATVHGRSFTLRWTGRDPAVAGGVAPTGVARYEVWRAANGRPARRIATTTAKRLKVAAKQGSRYAFFTIAIDRAGNREAAPTKPDATTRVVRP